MLSHVHALLRYRHFVASSVRTDFQARFVRSRMAGLWVILHPLIQVAIYAVILSSVLAGRFPGVDSKYAYAVYLLSGTLAWGLFSEIINRSLTVFIDHGNTLKKITFPRVTLPVIVVSIAMVNFVLLLLANIFVLVIIGRVPGLELVALVPLTALLVLFASSLGLLLGTLNVFMRDIAPVAGVLVQLWFWFTPIVYPVSVIPEAVRQYVAMNPLTPIVQGFQEVLLYGRFPDWSKLALIVLIACLLALLSVHVFRRAAPDMTDVL